ncbi:MAG: Gfo/Idh/MocA family oxidoreductase [Planctomycetaceae bacterium]|nr:Gfo/Idh/MocA family oxidoreductase [Planctomycetales bacterium]MCB9927348.1 Gfo/Idh/MocA family oxidoreductase [Planctomycetaceae bacterium]
MDRRTFLDSVALGAAYAATAHSQQIRSPNERVAVCVTGVRGRGGSLLNTFASLPDVDVKYVCDLDENVLGPRVQQTADKTGRKPQGIADYRIALDDKNLDAIVLGTPDHWHALPTIHACQVGKDVYVEKPDGHNIIEGQTMVAAMRKHGRVVQLGTQARSGIFQAAAMKYIAEGNLGKVRFAKAWESSKQGSIGKPSDSEPPKGVDYNTWLGPAPKRPFNPRRFHGSWRWFFDYGTGDLGNDGVHRLDVARWALETAVAAEGKQLASVPKVVSAHGGKYYFDDAQEWPDTMMVTYDYGGYLLTYEMRVWNRYPLHEESEGAAVYGDGGYVVIGNGRWRAFDERGKLVKEETNVYQDVAHAQNFIDCMRTRGTPVADLETVGHPSSLLCHLGNVAWRVGRTVKFDPATYTFGNDQEANRLLTRAEYRKPWVLPKLTEV